MRRITILVTALLALSGCGSGASTAPAGEFKVSDLAGDWQVAVPGQPGAAVLRLSADELRLRDRCDLSGGWVALPTGQFATLIQAGTGDCLKSDGSGAPAWLRSAARMRAAGDGWDVLDARGARVATLTPGTMPHLDGNLMADDPVRLTAADRERLDRVLPPLPAGVVPVTAEQLTGRWSPTPTAKPFAEFQPDGTYSGSDGCNGVTSRWITDGAGQVAVTSGVSTLIGCENLDLPSWFTGTRLSRTGDALVFYDAAGHQAHRLVKAPPAP